MSLIDELQQARCDQVQRDQEAYDKAYDYGRKYAIWDYPNLKQRFLKDLQKHKGDGTAAFRFWRYFRNRDAAIGYSATLITNFKMLCEFEGLTMQLITRWGECPEYAQSDLYQIELSEFLFLHIGLIRFRVSWECPSNE